MSSPDVLSPPRSGLFSLLGRLALWFGSLGPWRRWGVAVIAGAVTPLALPPYHSTLLLALTLPVLLWLLDGAKGWRGAFAVGWGFGTGFFASGLYWISNALLVDAERFGWLIPFALGGLGLGLGLFHGLLTTGVWLSKTRNCGRVLVFAGGWVLLEMLRGWVFTGFPWNLMGTVWADSPAMMQGASLVGAYGLSLLVMVVFSSPALLGWSGQRGQGRRASGVVVACALASVVLVWGAGKARLPAQQAPMVDGVRLRLVQPDIAQQDKWRSDRRQANLAAYLTLSLAPSDQPITHVIWGETAVPYALDGVHDGDLRAALGESLAEADSAAELPLLISGVVRRTPEGQEPFQVWNSLVALDLQGTVHGWYDKAHLVPFGEYIPLRGLLPIEKITAGSVDFTPGPGRVTMTLPGLPPVSPLICYEVIFPGQVTVPADGNQRPQWLLNLTNDGWYGLSAGPHQHYATARLRAVEQGIPLVRVANTGVSAIVDPWGREVAHLDLGAEGFVDGPLPRAIAPTLYAVVGNSAPLGLALMVLVIGLLQGRRAARRAEMGIGA
jgi:apolipoprotein N-acyltransferase